MVGDDSLGSGTPGASKVLPATTASRELQFLSLPGLTPYTEARELQQKMVDQRARGEIPDTVIFLEHEPVITRGRGLQGAGSREGGVRHMPAPMLPPGISFSETERGGDLTYHGPGQLVIYPICLLDGEGFGPRRDIDAFLRKFEGVLINVLARYGLAGEHRRDATGVWVGERKLASIGIAIRKWVTYHGMAVNVVNDFDGFRLISPCGFSPEVMVNLAELESSASLPPGWQPQWRAWLESELRREFTQSAFATA